MFCKNCGAEMPDECIRCTQCGNNPNVSIGKEVKREKNVRTGPKQKSKLLAGILQILFPYIGAGRLYLGNKYIALFEIIISFTCFWVPFPFFALIPFIPLGLALSIYDGVRILKGKVMFDANGIPLK